MQFIIFSCACFSIEKYIILYSLINVAPIIGNSRIAISTWSPDRTVVLRLVTSSSKNNHLQLSLIYFKFKRGEEEKLSYKFYFNIERLITNPKTSHFLEKNIDTNLQSFDNHFSLQEKLRWTLFIPVLKANSIPKERGRSTMELSWKSRSLTGHREPLSVV